MFQKLKNYLLYAGLEKDQWNLAKDLILKDNQSFLTMISMVLFIIMGILAVYTKFFDRVYPENAIAYATIAAIEFVLFALSKFAASKNLKMVPPLTMAFNIFMYAFGIAIGSYFDTQNYALAFIIMIIVLPQLFCVAPISSGALVLIMDVVFLYVSKSVKEPLVFEVDVMNVVIWTIVGVFLNRIVTSSRARNHWMIIEQTKSKRALENTLETVNFQMNMFKALGSIYTALYYVDLTKDTYEELIAVPETRAYFERSGTDVSARLRNFCENTVAPKHRREMLDFTDLNTVSDRLKSNSTVTKSFLSRIVRNAKNEEEWAELNIIAVGRNENSQVTGILVAVRKSHEEKMKELEQMDRLEAALAAAESSNKSKTVFLNSMSHDIRTPMNAITGFTNLARKYVDDKERVVDYLDKIAIANTHLLSLINDVLDMSRIESGRVSLNMKTECIPTIVRELKTIVQDDVDARKLSLNVALQGRDDRLVFCDKLRLKQILLNLLSNAIKFTDAGGHIDFFVKEQPAPERECISYVFTVRDSGIGMSEDFVKKIFQPFEREKTSTVSGIQGAGLGMSIAKNLVDMMGGNISVKSQLNVGSEFVVQLSFKLSENASDSCEKSKRKLVHVEPNQFAGNRILLVEDNGMNQLIIIHMLHESGAEIDVAENGLVACEKLEEHEPGFYDVVLMDIQMPVMDGYAATERIRNMKVPQLARIPIIAMTADAFEEDRERAFSAGMNGHISKPVDENLLMEMLSETFGAKT